MEMKCEDAERKFGYPGCLLVVDGSLSERLAWCHGEAGSQATGHSL